MFISFLSFVKMLLLKYNDNYDLFDEDERAEFIFRIFMHVTLGGDTEQVCGKVTLTLVLRTDCYTLYLDSVNPHKFLSHNFPLS